MSIVYPNNERGTVHNSTKDLICAGCTGTIPCGTSFTYHYSRAVETTWYKIRAPFCRNCYPFRYVFRHPTAYKNASDTPIPVLTD
jgi:hypothetical protein